MITYISKCLFINHMLKELTTLQPFFEDPTQVYSAREIAKHAKLNHITIAKKLKDTTFIKREKNGPYLGFKAEITKEFLQLRQLFNLQKLQDSKLIETLQEFYDEPTIILFGSYLNATNTKKSDIDIVIISTHKEDIDLSEFEKKLHMPIQLFTYTKKEFKELQNQHPELLNNILNGIVLNGEMEVFI